MRNRMAAILLVLFPTSAFPQFGTGATRAAPEIVSSGSGEVKLKPDRATLTIAVVTRAATAAEAGLQNVRRIQPLLAALRRQRLADSAIMTTGYTVALERDATFGRVPTSTDGPPAYVARNAVRVTLTELDALGQLLDSALAAGATEVANVAFSSSQAPQARQRAVALAVREARVSAEAGAVAAGGKLGNVIEVNLSPDNSMYFEFSSRVAGGIASATTPFMPSDVSVRMQARVRFEFAARP